MLLVSAVLLDMRIGLAHLHILVAEDTVTRINFSWSTKLDQQKLKRENAGHSHGSVIVDQP